MDSYYIYFIGFISGIICTKIWNYFYTAATTTLMMKRSINDGLILLSRNIQIVYEINELKYLALESLERDEKVITFQKHLDKRNLESIKNTVIRNFVNPIPKRFEYLVPFNDWDSAMTYINQEIKSKRG